MRNAIHTTLAAVAIASLAACATVPALKSAHAVDSNGRIKVQNVVDHIACELYRAIPDNPELLDQKYYVKILLNLQIDDEVDLTPSLSAIGPITPSTSLATTISGDYGLQRRRLFTTTYNIDMVQLNEDFDEATANYECKKQPNGGYPPFKDKLYDLQGDLRIEQIVDDGLKIVQEGSGIITNPAKPADPNDPTFGSQVQFIITKQLTSLGPLWTLRYFKGPSGANGLISGKILDTDSLTITFAPQLLNPQLTLKKLQSKTRSAVAALARARENLGGARQQQLIASPAEKAAADAEVARLTAVVSAADQAVADALAAERAPLRQPTAEEGEAGADAATSALQTSILLQSLSNLPR